MIEHLKRLIFKFEIFVKVKQLCINMNLWICYKKLICKFVSSYKTYPSTKNVKNHKQLIFVEVMLFVSILEF